jgi:hypothetical protein
MNIKMIIKSGVLWGTRVFDYLGTIEYHCSKYKCTLVFDPDRKNFIAEWFSPTKTKSDEFRGQIIQNDEKIIGTITGSWLRNVDFITSGNKRYRLWDRNNFKYSNLIPEKNPLPSDCRFRKDLQYLSKGDLEKASEWKLLLEEKQRKEKRWRIEGLKF